MRNHLVLFREGSQEKMIKEANKKILDTIENELKNLSLDFIEKTFNLSNESLKEYRSLQITILGLSTTIAGIIIPLILSSNLNVGLLDNEFLVTIILFGATIIFGVVGHSVTLSGERTSLKKNSEIKLKELENIRNDIFEIKKLEDNHMAGLKLRELQDKFKQKNQLKEMGDFLNLIYFSFFICGIIFTFYILIKLVLH